MVRPKKLFLAIFGLIFAVAWSLTPQVIYASSSKYYDFGPYYNQPQVLGFSFSNLESLPALTIPDNLIPPPATGIMPGSPFYPLERVTENIQLTFTFDPVKKEELRLTIASERLAEAKTLTDQGKTEAASQAVNDYGRTMSDVAQALSTLSQQDTPATQALVNKVEEAASAQAVVTQALSLSSSPAQAESWTEATKASIKVLDGVASVKGEPAVPQELSTGIQKLKEQGLISEEESNKLYSFKARSEVREELNKLVSSGQFPTSELTKLDTAVAKIYPEVQKAITTNLQVAELRSYQTLTQPKEEVLEEIKKWQENPAVPPPNDIKPYLWYNRAQDLAGQVDLSNFSGQQQSEVAKLYPQAVSDNPTYSPPPSPAPRSLGEVGPSPTPSPSPVPTDAGATPPQVTDQTATPAAAPSPSPQPSPTPPPTEPYLGETGGALPGEPFYFIKQAGEQLAFTFTFDQAEKSRLKMQQAERRLAEAAALADDPKKGSLYESTVKSYRSAMADASTYLKNAPDSKTAKEVAEKLESQAGRHEAVLEKGLLPPTKDPKLISEAIKATENAMDRSADVLDRPALPPILASRLGDLKAQGLILGEEVDDLTRSNSREEVRDKIRKLTEQSAFPPADAKKLDEAQLFTSSTDYNQLVEVRKVEELQTLRSVQTDFAQTPTLKATATSLGQKEVSLRNTFEPSVIKPEDLAGRDDLLKTYQTLVDSASSRPINGGQFGPEATPGAKLATTPPRPQDAVLTTCPAGATWNQFAGCVWADTGKAINDYDQYKCTEPRQYYSFAAKKCLTYEPGSGFKEDGQPICPVGYSWSWQKQSCQGSSIGGIIPLPSPRPESEPKDEKEIAERSKSCPHGSSFKVPQGCVWDKDSAPVYSPRKYRCDRGEYYSFEKLSCVSSPKPGEPYPGDAVPSCKDAGSIWSWSEGKCMPIPPEVPPSPELAILKPTFVTPGNPFYFLKQAGEVVQRATAFTPKAREQVSLSRAKERLAEAFDALKKNDEQAVKKAISSYTSMMQNLVGDLSREQLTNQAKYEIGQLLAKEAVDHNLLLQKLSALAPEEQDSTINAAVSVTILGVDKAADIAGEPPIPAEIKEKIEALPPDMISEENKKKLLETGSRVEVRLGIGGLISSRILTQADTAFLNEDFDKINPADKIKLEELKKLEEIATTGNKKEKIQEKIEKNEAIVTQLQEFEKTFEPGQDVPAEIRPYVRLTRINEVAQTIRPDIVRLEDFSNRKDLLLAVATLQEEYRPTRQAIQQVEEFRRRNPNAALPPEFLRIEALSYSLGVRNQAGPCYLPTPPFAPNTPCPAPGAAIPIASYTNYIVEVADRDFPVYSGGRGYPGYTTGGPATDKDGKPFVYGQGPKPESAGVCSDGYHWMYDSGGWCMSNSGNYSSSYNYTPTGTGPGYTPYSPYYTAPGVPPGSYGYTTDPNFINLYDPLPGGPTYNYSSPYYYGTAPTNYTTTPPAGTVPGTGPAPTSPGQCPSGYHWMSDSGGWCMANGNTYVPSSGGWGGPIPGTSTTTGAPPPGGYNCGSQGFNSSTGRCNDGACPSGYNWDGARCAVPSPNLNQESCGPGYYWSGNACFPNTPGGGGGYSSPSSYQYGCTPGNYWDGSRCVAGSYEGGGWSDTAARTQSWCQPPSGGCGSNSYWDYGSCYCRSSSTYSGGSGPSPSNQCQGLSCGGGAWLDYSTCSCRYSGGSGTSSTGSTITCYPPSQGCPGGWYDYGTCSCKTSGSGSTYPSGSTTSSGSCTPQPCSGTDWFDSGTCSCRPSSSTYSSGSTSGSGSPSTSSGSCSDGYHWMSDNGGWCMANGTSSPSPSPSTTTTTTSPSPSPSTTTTTTESSPSPSPSTTTTTTTTTTEPTPQPSPTP